MYSLLISSHGWLDFSSRLTIKEGYRFDRWLDLSGVDGLHRGETVMAR